MIFLGFKQQMLTLALMLALESLAQYSQPQKLVQLLGPMEPNRAVIVTSPSTSASA